MNQFLLILVMIPLLGAVMSLMVPLHKENAMSSLAFGTAAIQFFCFIYFSWRPGHRRVEINVKEITLYKTFAYQFFLDFYYRWCDLSISFFGFCAYFSDNLVQSLLSSSGTRLQKIL